MNNGEWKDVTKEFPPYDEDVLCYYEIARNKKDKEKEPHRYMVVGSLYSIREGKTFKIGDWHDKESNDINPTHWMKLPEPPKKPKS